ncbi:MAG: hypothetical protein WAU71_13220, partial [Pyrinomonadaceae bacterium]
SEIDPKFAGYKYAAPLGPVERIPKMSLSIEFSKIECCFYRFPLRPLRLRVENLLLSAFLGV